MNTILVVDDQEISRDALGAILEDEYTILYAENGQEALEILKARAEDISVVMLDLIMPVMNGFDVLKIIRADEEMKKIPVVVLTAEREAELKALQAGAADFIAKPFDEVEVIRARVSRLIEMSEGRKLISAAERDRLTGLYNRNFYIEYTNRLFRYHPEIRMDALALNIEQFHSVNALHGREFGDEVLRALGKEVLAFVTETDGIAGRIEGDRIVIFCAEQPDYRAVLDRFQQKLNDTFPGANIHLRMGVGLWTEDTEPFLLADKAWSACKLARGNYQQPVRIFDEEMRKKEMLNQRLLNDLPRALEERQLTVFYQPKYNVQCDPPRLASAEALVRWRHPELGMISPGTFIPLFESNGLIGVIDHYVWNEAAAQIRKWREKYGFTLPVSVNLSRADVFDPQLGEKLDGMIESNGLDYKDIKLEVTESAYTDNAKTVLEVIRGLREKGFQIEMDDFGSGYSSLNMLSDMPIDVLKMDMKFVRNIAESETDRRLVALILDIAKYLRVAVVAEGVETEEQLKILREGGCDLVQGYYFSRPLPPEEFEQLIEKHIEAERKAQP
jgi:diguanylate cyclase (GGDEF)-like protein